MFALPRTTPEEELLWREAVWEELQAHPSWPDLPPELLREVGLYGGAAGIWLDKSKTSQIHQSGIAVSVLYTGKHYDDDIDEDGIIYHYPTTKRHPSFDASEIESVKQAGVLQIPIFVILKKGKYREVRRAWVSDFDDINRLFLIEFGIKQPTFIQIEVDKPFEAKAKRNLTVDQIIRVERNPRFKFEVNKRHRGRCAVTGLSVVEMLDGVHVVPVAQGGSDDPRNGLLLSASHHRAFDKHLWSINPKTLEIETSPKGPSLKAMKFERDTVKHLLDTQSLPHLEALEIRYKMFEKANKAA
jgi:putative restriction endonuclease